MYCQRNSAKISLKNTLVISGRGGYGDNPTVQSFGYNDLTIATQRSIAPVIRGNVAGRHTGESSKWFVVSEEPLPKRSVSLQKRSNIHV